MFPQKPPDEPEDKAIAQALVAILDTQDAIIRMLWSIRSGTQNASFLDDSDFQVIDMRRRMAKAALVKKFKVL
jgi:hypothetical protein